MEVVCPVCKARACRRSRRRNAFDYAMSALGVLPWRCPTCESRFHARRVPVSIFVRAHCPRCGNPQLQKISSDRVDEGIFLPIKRMLKLPAYRCDPCRMKFHSLRPRYRGARPGAQPAKATS